MWQKNLNIDRLNQINITCKACRDTFPFQSIVQHVNKSKCSITYSEDQKANIRKHSEEITAAKHKIRKAESYQMKKAEICAEMKRNYQKNKKIVLKKRAKKYQEHKEEIAKTYDKTQRALKYQEQREQIAKKYKDDKEKMESN